MATELQSPPTRRQPADPPGGIATAVLFATAPSGEGGPAACLPWHDGTLVGRLLVQLADIGVPKSYVITRPDWEDTLREAIERAGAEATLLVSAGRAATWRSPGTSCANGAAASWSRSPTSSPIAARSRA